MSKNFRVIMETADARAEVECLEDRPSYTDLGNAIARSLLLCYPRISPLILAAAVNDVAETLSWHPQGWSDEHDRFDAAAIDLLQAQVREDGV